MVARLRDGLVPGSVIVVMIIAEWFALRAGTLGVVLIAVLIALLLILVLARADLGRIAVATACASAFTLTWNGWFVGPVRPGDVLILLALLLFGVAAPATAFRSPPWWVKQLALALVLLVLLITLLPPDPNYLDGRVVLDAVGQPTVSTKTSIPLANIGIAFKFIVAIGAIPVAFTAAAIIDRRSVRWLGVSFAAGTALSGFAAFVDHSRIASIGHYITHLPNIGDRQVGFANQPNFLAAGLVLAVPFACWLAVSLKRWERWLGLACLLFLVLGEYASGSRGGAVTVLLTVLVSFALLRRTRPHLPGIVLAGLAATGIIAVLFPHFGAQILRVTRLAGNDATTAGSDSVRATVGEQGIHDFVFSPIHGIGLQVSTQASQVYIQEMASGGLILLIAMSVYMLGGMWTAWQLMRRYELAAAVLGAMLGTLVLNIFEADLTDRFYYVPEAILIALLFTGPPELLRPDAMPDAGAPGPAAEPRTEPALESQR